MSGSKFDTPEWRLAHPDDYPTDDVIVKDAVDLLNDQLTVTRNEFAAYRCKAEAQIEVLELTISRLRCVCDAAFTVVREDGDEDGWTAAWQELVSALEDARYEVQP